jgi:tetratricopeptide (TPR) repeat protein
MNRKEQLAKALKLAGLRKYKEALDLYNSIIEENCHDIEARRGRAEVLFKLDRASEAHYDLGIAHYIAGKYEVAEKHFQKAIELKNSFLEAHYGLASVYYCTGEYSKLRQELRKILKSQPKDSRAKALRAMSYLKQNSTFLGVCGVILLLIMVGSRNMLLSTSLLIFHLFLVIILTLLDEKIGVQHARRLSITMAIFLIIAYALSRFFWFIVWV